jgi:hypothetical protein
MFLRRQGKARRSTPFQPLRRIKRPVRRRHTYFNKAILKHKLCKQREVRGKKKEKKEKEKRGEMVLGQCGPVGSHPMSIHTRTLSTKHHQPPPDASSQHCRCSSIALPFLLSTTPPALFSSSLSCLAAPLHAPTPHIALLPSCPSLHAATPRSTSAATPIQIKSRRSCS